MKKFISISLILTLFFSLTGYMIPCTLHCLHAQPDHSHMFAEMNMGHNHDMENVADCDGMCSIDKNGSGTDHHNTSGTSSMQLSQFMAQVFTATLFDDPFLKSPVPVNFFNPVNTLQIASWITGPPAPPPRLYLFHS